MDVRPPGLDVAARARLVVRWLLVGAVIVGVLAMHVLGEPDGTTRAVPADRMSSVAVLALPGSPAMASTAMSMTGAAVDALDRSAPALVAIADRPSHLLPVSVALPGMGGMAAMTCCVLFLITGAGALLLAMLRALRSRLDLQTNCSTTQLTAGPRAPPVRRALRLSLCILRV